MVVKFPTRIAFVAYRDCFQYTKQTTIVSEDSRMAEISVFIGESLVSFLFIRLADIVLIATYIRDNFSEHYFECPMHPMHE